MLEALHSEQFRHSMQVTHPTPANIRILIADDHAIVRAGLKQFIADEPDMEVTGEAETGAQTLELVRGGDWDVVLLDISMPDRSGGDTLKTLKHLRPDRGACDNCAGQA